MSATSCVLTWGICDHANAICLAVARRTERNGSRSISPTLLYTGSGGASTFCGETPISGLGPLGAGGGAAGCACLAANARTSSAVTLPPGPLAGTACSATPSSRASRRVEGAAGTGRVGS